MPESPWRIIALLPLLVLFSVSRANDAEKPVDFKGHEQRSVLCVAFSPNGKVLASTGIDGTAKLWDPKTAKLQATLKICKLGECRIAFSPDGETLASVGLKQPVTLWDVTTGEVLATLPENMHGAHAVAFAPNGKLLATAGYDCRTRLWDLTNNKELVALEGHAAVTGVPVTSLAFSPDSKTLASASRDQTVILWDVAKRKARLTLQGHKDFVNCVAFSHDGKTLASASNDRTVVLWDPRQGKRRKTIDWTKLMKGGINAVAFSPDDKRLAIVAEKYPGGVFLWDLVKDREVIAYKGHESWPVCVAFSPNGKTIVTGSDDDPLMRLWKVPADK